MVQGGQIYEGGRFRTSVTESGVGRTNLHLANQGVQEQLDSNKEQALILYQQGLKVSAAQNMEEVYNNYQNNPEALKAELDKLSEKMTAEIPDINTKIAFRTNFITQSSSLINRAQANYDKIQYQKKKSSYFDTIQANNKSIATALNNAFNGTGTADDLVNYQTAIKQNLGLINARNDDGTYIFTDAQRLSMSNSMDKLASESFSNALNDMNDDKRTEVIEALNNDSMILIQSEDEGETKELKLKDAFSPEIYADMKKSATILDNKIKNQQLKEYNFNKRYSEMVLNTEGGEQNYKIWEYYHKDASDEKKAQMKKIAGFLPDEENVTNFESVSDYIDAMKDLSQYNVENDNDANEFINKATDYISAAMVANHNRDDNNNPKISSKDLTEQTNKMFEMMGRKTISNLVSKMPNGNWFEKMMATPGAITSGTFKPESQVAAEISKIAIDTMTKVTNLAFEPLEDNETEEDREKKMWKAYRKGKEEATKVKYWYLPDIQRGLIEGKMYEINGRFYKYNGDLSENCWELVE